MLLKSSAAAVGGLLSLASATPVDSLEARQVVCPAGYGYSTNPQPYVQTNIVLTPVVINQYFGNNTTINIFGSKL